MPDIQESFELAALVISFFDKRSGDVHVLLDRLIEWQEKYKATDGEEW